MTRRTGTMVPLVLLSSVVLLSCAAQLPPAPMIIDTPRPPVPHVATQLPPLASAVVFTGSMARNVPEAIQEALQVPQPWKFHGGVLVYTATPGSRYLVPLAEGRVTTLRFGTGEMFFTVVGGLPRCEDLKTDDVDLSGRCLWITETVSGESATKQPQVLIRPNMDGLKSNLMVTTSWAAYDIEVVSAKGRSIPVVQWEHLAPVTPARQQPAPEILGIGYALTSRGEVVPRWIPEQVWDDTKHTYIRFPETIGAMKLPLLYEVIAGTMEEHLINYRVYEGGRLMVADGVFDAAVLRVGKDPTAELVDLRRTGDYQYLRCPQDPSCPVGPARVVGR